VNNVLLERMNGTLPLKYENEYVQGENGRILATGHYCMEEDHIQPWLEGTDESRIGRVQQNVKYEYGVTELKIKDAQINGKRTNRILKESTYDAQNFMDNNDIGKNGIQDGKGSEKVAGGKSFIKLLGKNNREGLVMLADTGNSMSKEQMLEIKMRTEEIKKKAKVESKCPGFEEKLQKESNTVNGDNLLATLIRQWADDQGSCNKEGIWEYIQKIFIDMVDTFRFTGDPVKMICADVKGTSRGGLLGRKKEYCKAMLKIFLYINGLTQNITLRETNTDRIKGVGAYLTCLVGNVTLIDLYGEHCWFEEIVEYISKAMGPHLKQKKIPDNSGICKSIDFGKTKIGTQLVGVKIKEWIEDRRVKDGNNNGINRYKDLMESTRRENDCKEHEDKGSSKSNGGWLNVQDIMKIKETIKKGEYVTRTEADKIVEAIDTSGGDDKILKELGEKVDAKIEEEKQRIPAQVPVPEAVPRPQPVSPSSETGKKDKEEHDMGCIDDSTIGQESTAKFGHAGGTVILKGQHVIDGQIPCSVLKKLLEEQSTEKSTSFTSGEIQTKKVDAPTRSTSDSQTPSTEADTQEPAPSTSSSAPGSDGQGLGGGSADGVTQTTTKDVGVTPVASGEAGVSGSGPSALAEKDDKVHNGTDTEHREDGEEVDPEKIEEGKDAQDIYHSLQESLNPHTDEGESLGQTHTEKDAEASGAGTLTPGQDVGVTLGDGGSADVKPFEGPATTENGGAHGDPAEGSIPSLPNDPSVLAGGEGESDVKKEESEKSKANLDGESGYTTEQGTLTITETQPEQFVGVSPHVGGVDGPDSNHSEGPTPLSKTESLESNGSVHETTNDTTHSLENTNGDREKDLKEHDFNNSNMQNGGHNSNQTAHVDDHHRGSIREDEAERGVHMNQDNFMKNPNRYQLYSHNNWIHDKLDINQYKNRDVNAAREEIIRMSKAHKCNNSVSLNYCNSIEDKMSSNTCSKEDSKNLCCSISDFCLKYFKFDSNDYHNCMKKEFEDPSYKCFTKGSFTNKAYFAAGGAFLILLLLMAAQNMNNYE
ncbi:Duffy binding protein, partial [Plasmodium coatneyi]